jgi:site-specific DNA recombinase
LHPSAWSKSAIRVILTNPRYTGVQVWNKQRTDEVLLDVNDVALGHTAVARWNSTDKWVTSKTPAHQALVDPETFEQVQALLARRARTSTAPARRHRTRNPYVFTSLINCGICHRKMQGQHSHGIAYYRCRYPSEYALANHVDHPRNVIMREEILIKPLDTWLTQQFAPHHRQHTVAHLIHQAKADQLPAATTTPTDPDEAIIAACDAKLARYRAALDAGADPTVVTTWIAETQTERQQAQTRQAQARTGPSPLADEITRLTEAQLTAIIDELADLTEALRDADPAHKLEVYRSLGLRLTFEPQTQTVRAEIDLAAHRWDSVGVRGPILTTTT